MSRSGNLWDGLILVETVDSLQSLLRDASSLLWLLEIRYDGFQTMLRDHIKEG